MPSPLNGSINPNAQVHIADDLPREAARFIAETLSTAIRERGRSSIALSGGSTPKPVFAALVNEYRSTVDWSKVLFFWSDERYVPGESADSNQPMAYDSLLSPLAIDPAQIYPVPTDSDSPDEAARIYADTIRVVLGEDPAFDLVLLGMGDDGHTASLFPNTAAFNADDPALVVANHVPQVKNTQRITFTFGLINAARVVLFLISGAGKAEIVEKVLISEPGMYPSQWVERPIFFLDKAAGTKLENKS